MSPTGKPLMPTGARRDALGNRHSGHIFTDEANLPPSTLLKTAQSSTACDSTCSNLMSADLGVISPVTISLTRLTLGCTFSPSPQQMCLAVKTCVFEMANAVPTGTACCVLLGPVSPNITMQNTASASPGVDGNARRVPAGKESPERHAVRGMR